jgi:hypothetical protein
MEESEENSKVTRRSEEESCRRKERSERIIYMKKEQK